MNEVKRGAPTEDGVYIVKVPYGERMIEMRDGKAFWYPGDVRYGDYADILAHRKHEPLVVPPLKELHRCQPVKPCVVRVTRSGDKTFNGVYYSERRRDGRYLIHCPHAEVPQLNWSTTVELTRLAFVGVFPASGFAFGAQNGNR